MTFKTFNVPGIAVAARTKNGEKLYMHERNYELAKSILTNEQVDTGTL
jgi:hypothetical protein